MAQPFDGLQEVINILVFCTIISVVARVFHNDLISRGKNWLMFGLRAGKDVITLASVYFVLRHTNGEHGAVNYAIIDVVVNTFFLAALAILFYVGNKKTPRSIDISQLR